MVYIIKTSPLKWSNYSPGILTKDYSKKRYDLVNSRLLVWTALLLTANTFEIKRTAWLRVFCWDELNAMVNKQQEDVS